MNSKGVRQIVAHHIVQRKITIQGECQRFRVGIQEAKDFIVACY